MIANLMVQSCEDSKMYGKDGRGQANPAVAALCLRLTPGLKVPAAAALGGNAPSVMFQELLQRSGGGPPPLRVTSCYVGPEQNQKQN